MSWRNQMNVNRLIIESFMGRRVQVKASQFTSLVVPSSWFHTKSVSQWSFLPSSLSRQEEIQVTSHHKRWVRVFFLCPVSHTQVKHIPWREVITLFCRTTWKRQRFKVKRGEWVGLTREKNKSNRSQTRESKKEKYWQQTNDNKRPRLVHEWKKETRKWVNECIFQYKDCVVLPDKE